MITGYMNKQTAQYEDPLLPDKLNEFCCGFDLQSDEQLRAVDRVDPSFGSERAQG